MARYDENGNYITDPPMSRIEQRLARIEKLIEEGGGGGDAETASEEDIQDIKDTVWDDDETATQEDIDSIKDSINW